MMVFETISWRPTNGVTNIFMHMWECVNFIMREEFYLFLGMICFVKFPDIFVDFVVSKYLWIVKIVSN